MPKIQKARKGVTWCGPAALAYLCGLTYEEAERAILRARKRHGNDRKIIRGVWTSNIIPTLNRFYTVQGVHVEGKPNLRKWIEWDRRPKSVYLVTVTGHYVVVSSKGIFDNQSGLVPLDSPKQLRKRVKSVLLLKPRKGQDYRLGLTLQQTSA